MTQTRNLSPVRCEPPDPPFDVDEQPEIENERLGVEREWGVGDLRFLQCLSPITVYRENSPQDPFPKPVDTRKGTNRLGNKWDKNYFGMAPTNTDMKPKMGVSTRNIVMRVWTSSPPADTGSITPHPVETHPRPGE